MNHFFEIWQENALSKEEEALWEKAVDQTRLPDPSCCEPAWALSYHAVHGAKRPVLAMFEHGNCLLLCEERISDTALLMPLESAWLYTRPLLGSDPIPLFFKALEFIEKHYKKFPKIVLGGMWPHEPTCNEILLNLGHCFSFYLASQGEQCSASLKEGMDGFLSRRSSNFRAKLKKAVRRAKENGISYERVCPNTVSSAKDTYQRMLNVEKQSWKGSMQNGLLHDISKPFYDCLLKNYALRNMARVIFAIHEGQDIGFIFGGVRAGIYRGQQFSYDNHWRSFSIGNTLQFEQILWLCEEGVGRYDMGPITGPKMGYKAHWTETNYPIQSWVLEHN